MAAPKKEWKNCKHCGRVEAVEGAMDGFVYSVRGHHLHQLSCPCGIMTKLCATKAELQAVWNSTPTKPVKVPKVSVKHPGPRGMEPGTVHGGTQGGADHQPF